MAICQCQGEERRVMTDVSDRWPQTLFVQIRFQSFSRHWMSGKIDRGEKSQLYRNHSILNNIQQQSNIVPSNSHLQEVIISYVQQNLNSAKHGDGEIQKIFTLRHLFCLKPKRNQQIIPCYKLFSSNIYRITNINIDEKKHRKNCECCPGHYLIVNHYSPMSWFKFRNLSAIVNCVTKSLIHSR